MSTSFKYEARAPSGRIERGALEAPNRNEALARLKRRQLTPYSLKPVTASQMQGSRKLDDAAARDLTRTLAQLLRAGLSFPQALKFASEELPRAAAAPAQAMREAAERGEPASSALEAEEGAPAKLLAGVVRAGETSGKLADALEVAASSFGRAAELKSRLASALIYPAFVITATLATLAAFIFLVVPTLAQAFTGAEERLPASTRALLAFSDWLRTNGALAGGMMIALGTLAASNRATRTTLSRLADRILASPLGLGVAERLDFAAFASLSALSLQAGVPAAAAFETAAIAVRNSHIRAKLASAVAAIRIGERPSQAIERSAQPPKSFQRLMHLGEETGKLGDTLRQASLLLASEAEQRLERLGAVAGPIITLVLGIIVAGVVMSLFLGLLSLSELATL
ncbi:MAG: type II secretion system F family protein [Hyphomonadaceae bacterium]|nr:type II secretion system F family protein [Hyphomonadaceae bacterium]